MYLRMTLNMFSQTLVRGYIISAINYLPEFLFLHFLATEKLRQTQFRHIIVLTSMILFFRQAGLLHSHSF